MRPLRVAVADMWPHAELETELLLRALRETTPVEVVGLHDADLLLFSVFGHAHEEFVGTKVQYTGENTRPPWDATDFCIGFDLLDDPRYLRLPLAVLVLMQDRWQHPPLPPGPPWEDRDFCLFLASYATPEREAVVRALSAYRPVTCPGAALHNVDVPELEARGAASSRPSKLRYQRGFRFTVAYENGAYPGYTTEKLVDALVTGTIPIYWGNPEVARDVHPDCFVDARTFPDLDALVDHVREIDRDPALAARYRAREDFLVRSVDDYWRDLVTFLGTAAASVGTRPRRVQRRRAKALTRRRRAGGA